MSETPADWYPDPYGRHELRYWDGELWTDHVSSHGRQSSDPAQPTGSPGVIAAVDQIGVSATTTDPDKISDQIVAHQTVAAAVGNPVNAAAGQGALASDLLGQRLFVVNQKAKLIEVNNEYAIFNHEGMQIGAVRQVGQSTLKKVARVVSSLDQFMTHHLQVVDLSGAVVLTLTRPAKFVKSRVIVNDAMGNQVGEIAQNNVFGKIKFSLKANGQEVGSINAENWRAWNFNVQNAQGEEVARITKTFEGVLKTAFTTADNYVVEVHRDLQDPLRQMVVAAALSVDTALKQDSRGFG
jgi:uncharacterized protein YxjI